ncbi:MAG TPA: hypothetical protein VFE44_07090 [Thermoanaerobaculia bacterium]|nr:hypothetical protein [Thermoanaerobaculia bacterium]
MAKKSSQTFAKRQKEMARKEKQERKAQRRMERNRLRAAGLPFTPESVEDSPEGAEEVGGPPQP